MNIQKKYTKHILAFLEARPYIAARGLERAAGIPRDTLAQAKLGNRLIPEDSIYKLMCTLAGCGIKDIDGYRLTYLPDIDCLSGARHVREYMTTEVLTMNDGTEHTRQVTDEMHHPDGWVDPLDGKYSSSRFEYYTVEDRIFYSNADDLLL